MEKARSPEPPRKNDLVVTDVHPPIHGPFPVCARFFVEWACGRELAMGRPLSCEQALHGL
jgi:hypothetical protein